jgi:hypothetical protein
MSRLIKLAVCASILIPSAAAAHNLIEPLWASAGGTTFQDWTFDDADNPASPEVIRNEYGAAAALIAVGDMGAGWLGSLPGLGSQTGFWDLGSGGTIVLDIDNRPLALPYKEIWVQVTYFADISAAPVVDVPMATLIDSQTVVVEDLGMGGWLLDQSSWRIEPNPLSEQIIVTADPMWGSIVDQVVVNTICVPEPATTGLLAVGGLFLLRKKRQNRYAQHR